MSDDKWEISITKGDGATEVVTANCDNSANEAIMYFAEMDLWDGIEPGQSATLTVKLNHEPPTEKESKS
jgi:hypothetical protein